MEWNRAAAAICPDRQRRPTVHPRLENDTDSVQRHATQKGVVIDQQRRLDFLALEPSADEGVDRAAFIGGMQVTFEPLLDHFEGYKLKRAPNLPQNCHLTLDDTLTTAWDGSIEYTVGKVAALLAPADKSEKGGHVAPFPPFVPELDARLSL